MEVLVSRAKSAPIIRAKVMSAELFLNKKIRGNWFRVNCFKCGLYSEPRHARDWPQECPVFAEVWTGEVSEATADKIGFNDLSDTEIAIGDWRCRLKISRIKKNREDRAAYEKIQGKLKL